MLVYGCFTGTLQIGHCKFGASPQLLFCPKMFKKDPQAKASANVKSLERRKLFAAVCKSYGLPQEQLSKEAEMAIMPATTKQASFESVQGHKGTIYTDENETPTWFKTRDSQLYPLLFTLWKAPYILAKVQTHPHVVKILSGGAGLMLPGTVPPFDKRAIRGAIVGVVDTDHPTVIKAVGRCMINMSQYDSVVGKTGIAVEILHCVGDELCAMNKFVDIPVPSEDLLDEYPLKEEETSENRPETEVEDGTEDFVAADLTSGAETPSERAETDNLAEVLTELSVEDIDNFFIRALLQTLKNDTVELPATASTFMSGHIYKNLPVVDSSYANVKKTSWKKTAKFLKAMDKLKYLSVKGKDEELSIVSLMAKETPVVQSFVPHKTIASGPSSAPKSNRKDKTKELAVVYLYKPTNKASQLFSYMGVPFQKLYTQSELKKLLDQYIRSKELVNAKNPKNVNVDDTLNSITNLGVGSVLRDKLFKPFLTNCSPLYKILKPGESVEDSNIELYKGEPPKIKIITQTKIGRKVITRMLNFEKFYVKLHVLADDLKVRCLGSTTTGPCVENPALTEVTVQGPHGKIVIDYFLEKGVPVLFIDFVDKLKKKGKR